MSRIGIVVFEYAAESGQIGPVVRHLSALEDPGRPIPPEATAVHHITDEMVKGHRSDDAAVAEVLRDVSLVIAHNSTFDRPFLEARFPIFSPCRGPAPSRHRLAGRPATAAPPSIPGLPHGLLLRRPPRRDRLPGRAGDPGRPLGNTPQSVFQALLECARKPVVKLYALNYRLSPRTGSRSAATGGRPRKRSGWVSSATAWEQEAAWIKQAVYEGASVEVQKETLDARVKYSGRAGRKERDCTRTARTS